MTLIQKPTKVTLEGKGALTLRQTDYVTQGGEGAIYRRDDRIIKLYLDPKKMVQDDMTGKVRVLAKELSHPSIVAPEGLVINERNQPIGYHMPFVTGESYPRLFTNEYRIQSGFDDQSTIALTAKMHEVIAYAHTKQALMVDANELNWLADVSNVKQPVPYVIDVDSWQIDRYKASVIMPSIRDWHGSINVLSDWFAWGVVTFLLFTGIHPYKGKLDGYKPGDMELRMKNNASVFLPEVRLNKAVREFTCIPGPLLDWYQATFTQGERTVPPSPLQTGRAQTTFGQVLRIVVTATGGLVFEKLLELQAEKITSVWSCGVVCTDQGNLIEVASKKKIGSVQGTRVAVVARDTGWIVAEEIEGIWQWRFINRSYVEQTLTVPLVIKDVVRSGERLFVVTENELVELTLQQFSTPVITIGQRRQILGNATQWFRGMGVSNVLGAMHLIVPYGTDAVALVRVPELDGLRVVNARAGTRYVAVVTLDQDGEYQMHECAFSADWKQYVLHVHRVDTPDLNCALLPKGVVASIKEDGELTITVPTQNEVKIISHKDVGTDMRLDRILDRVVYRKDGVLWSLRMQ